MVALYEGVKAEIQGQTDDTPDRRRGLEREIRRTNGAIGNLMNAIKVGGEIQELVDELKACKEKRDHLEEEKDRTEASRPPAFKKVNIEDVRTGLRDLGTTLEFATGAERKDLLAENIRRIGVPKEGRPYLEENPEGLLSAIGCLDVDTLMGAGHQNCVAPSKSSKSLS